MECFHLAQKAVPELIEHLKKIAPLYGPHRKGEKSYSFERVTNSGDVVLDYNRTLLSLKKYFLPPTERLLRFSIQKQKVEEEDIKPEKRIFFGVHSYDMQAILRLDHNMIEGHPESGYILRRQDAIFIGISFEPDEYHFSRSVGIRVEEMEGFDLFLNKVDKDYHLFILNKRGSELLKGFNKLKEVKEIVRFERNFKNKIKYHYNRIPEVFEHVYHSEVWHKVAQRCLGCGTCNLMCPTCYCFDVTDDVALDIQSGERLRRWDSCMLTPFAEVAGGENFRDKYEQRTRHRVYRKFKYITDREGVPWCVGCGRCTAFCPAGISLTEIVNDLIQEYEHQQYAKTGVVA